MCCFNISEYKTHWLLFLNTHKIMLTWQNTYVDPQKKNHITKVYGGHTNWYVIHIHCCLLLISLFSLVWLCSFLECFFNSGYQTIIWQEHLLGITIPPNNHTQAFSLHQSHVEITGKISDSTGEKGATHLQKHA